LHGCPPRLEIWGHVPLPLDVYATDQPASVGKDIGSPPLLQVSKPKLLYITKHLRSLFTYGLHLTLTELYLVTRVAVHDGNVDHDDLIVLVA